MNIFITGGAGLLGSTLIRTAPKDVTVFASVHENRLVPKTEKVTFVDVDIRNTKEVSNVISRIKPSYIIHTAAKGSPDFCEFNKDEAWKVNVEGTRNILEAAKQVNAKTFFTSSNQVFSGNNPPYNEKSPVSPVNHYGKTKVQTETDIIENGYNAVIVRLMTMYGWSNPKGQKNVVPWLVESLTAHKPLKVVDDIFNNFLYVYQAAEALWELVLEDKKLPKINIAGADTENRYNFAVKVASIFNLDETLLTPVKKDYFKEEAPRPLNTIYDISLFKKTFQTKAYTLEEGFAHMRDNQDIIEWEEK